MTRPMRYPMTVRRIPRVDATPECHEGVCSSLGRLSQRVGVEGVSVANRAAGVS
jgi:hypothetical protein